MYHVERTKLNAICLREKDAIPLIVPGKNQVLYDLNGFELI